MGDQRFEKQGVLEELTPVLSPTQVEAARRLVLRQPDGDVLVRMLGLEQ